MTSFMAFSNYSGVATADADDPGTATSNYAIPYRFTLTLDYGREFFDGYETRGRCSAHCWRWSSPGAKGTSCTYCGGTGWFHPRNYSAICHHTSMCESDHSNSRPGSS